LPFAAHAQIQCQPGLAPRHADIRPGRLIGIGGLVQRGETGQAMVFVELHAAKRPKRFVMLAGYGKAKQKRRCQQWFVGGW
jgi:hypothetical protein